MPHRLAPPTSALALAFAAACWAALGSSVSAEPRSGRQGEAAPRPNVLFISVDDLNDWIEPLGGHPQARTPNLSRLAQSALTLGTGRAARGRSSTTTGGTVNMPVFENMYVSFDWSPIDLADEETGDHRSVAWVAADPRFAERKRDLARHVPADPAPMVKTSYVLEPHHYPPYWDHEDYRERRGESLRNGNTVPDPFYRLSAASGFGTVRRPGGRKPVKRVGYRIPVS